MKLFRSLALLGTSLVIHSSLQACMNDYRPNVAASARSQSLASRLTEHPTKESWPERRARLRNLLAEGGDFRVKNDLATTLAHTGEVAEAMKLLEQVEAEKPGLYFTAANLGTVYELAGNDRLALEWIRKGIERNPEAHEGTEWLHVRILEAKLALAENPEWLELHSILDGRERSQVPRIPSAGEGKHVSLGSRTLAPAPEVFTTGEFTGNKGEKLTKDQVKAALIYQLHERLQFVRPPDFVVGALLLDLGDFVSEEATGMEGAEFIFSLSQRYLPSLPDTSHLQIRLDDRHIQIAAERMKAYGNGRHAKVFVGWLTYLAVVLTVLLIVLIVRRIFRPKATET